MPDFNFFADDDYRSSSSFGNFSNLTPEQVSQTNDQLGGPGRKYGFWQTIGGDAALGAVDLVDTVASSVPGLARIAGTERGVVNQKFLNMMGKPGLTQFYNDNKQGIEVASGIYGIIATQLATDGLARVAGPAMAGLKEVPFARRILSLDTQYQRSLASLRMVDKAIAARGIQGADAFRAAAEVPVSSWTKEGLKTSMQTVLRPQLATQTRVLGALNSLKSTAASEALMALTLNSNDFLYPDDPWSLALGYGGAAAIGGLVGAVGANYAIKSFLQRDSIARIRAGALDPTGMESKIMGSFGKNQESQWLGNLKGVYTDEATSYFVQADAKALDGVDQSTYNQLRLQRQNSGFVQAEKATQGGLLGLPETRFKGVIGTSTPEGNTVRAALLQDPGALYGVEMAGRIADDSTPEITHLKYQAGIQARKNEVSEKLIKLESQEGFDYAKPGTEYENLQQEMKQLNWADKLTPSLLTPDGERVPLSFGKVMENWTPNNVISKKLGTDDAWESMDLATNKSHKIAVTDKLGLIVKDFANQGPIDRLRTFRTFKVAIKKLAMKSLADDKFNIRLPDNPSWIQLDAAEEILKQTDGRARVYFPGSMTRESAQVESFAQKIDQMRAAGIDLGGDSASVAKARMMYNLPQLSAYEMGLLGTQSHPMDYLARGALTMMDTSRSANPIRDLTLSDLKDGFTKIKNMNDLSEMSGRDVNSIAGKSFDYMLDAEGNEAKHVMVYSRPLKEHDWFKSVVADRIGIAKRNTMMGLTQSAESPVIRTLASGLYSSSDLELAGSLNKLHDLQMAPSTPGFGNVAPQSGLGSAMKAISSQNWTARFSVPLQAMTRMRESLDRAVRGYTKDTFNKYLGDRLDRLAAPNSLETNSLLDQWMTPGVASGWDIQRSTIKTAPNAAGKQYHGFMLEMTEGNKARFKTQFGRELQKGQQLLGPAGKPVVMDDLGMEILDGIKGLTDEHRINSNTILRATNQSEIAHREWYVPPPDLTGKYWALTQDELGKTVPGGTIIANTEKQLSEMIEKVKANPDSPINRPGHVIRRRQELQDFGSIIDRSQMEMVDANEIWGKGGKVNQGLNAVGNTMTGSFHSALKQIRNNYHDMTSQLLETIYQDEIKMAQHRSQLAAGEVATRESQFAGVSHRSTWDYWLQELRGQNPSNHAGSSMQWANRFEGTVNRILKETTPKAAEVWHNMNDFMSSRLPWTNNPRDKAAFEKLSTDMGNYFPFQSIADGLEQRGYKDDAKTLSQILGVGSKFTATWMLRMMEVGNAVMNMAGIVNALPAVSRYMTPRMEEIANTGLYEARVGHSATIIQTPEGGVHGAMDMAKLAIRGINDSMKPDAFMARFQEHTRNLGMRNQEVAEFQRQLNSINSVSDWKAFWVGDAKRKGFKSKGVVGWLSVISDKSEDFSRSISLDIGARLGRDLGISDMDSLAKFSHDFANRMIADYSPHNRPEVFQTAIGAPFGLFQSYMWNYFERMFRYIETGDAKSFAIQSAMQGTLFGAQTVPGFSEINKMFFQASEGQSSPLDGLHNKFGHAAGDVISAGVLGNLPQLFGVDAGLNLYSRGGTEARIPGFSAPAAFTVVNKVKEGIGTALQVFSAQNPQITTQQLGEILSNALPNRPLAGQVETLLAGGKDTDSYGQLVSQNVNMFESVARMLGLRSMRQANETDAYYANKQMQEIKASKDEILREGSRALIRAQGEDALPKLYEAYILNGGDERNFTRWYRDNYESATQTRSERSLDDLMKDGDKMKEIQRLIDAGVTTGEEEQEMDPANLTGSDPMDRANPVSDDTIPDYSYQF